MFFFDVHSKKLNSPISNKFFVHKFLKFEAKTKTEQPFNG